MTSAVNLCTVISLKVEGVAINNNIVGHRWGVLPGPC